MDRYYFEIIVILIFTFLSAFFSGSESALFSLTRGDIHNFSNSGSGIERAVAIIMRTPQKILITILIGNLFVNLVISALTTKLMLLRWNDFGHFISIAIVTPLMIILCEISPKVIAINNYKGISKTVFPLLNIFHRLFSPLRIFMLAVTNIIIRVFKLRLQHKNITEYELGIAVSAGEKEGLLEKEESDIIRNIIRFSKKEGSNIMFPRNRAVFIPYGSTIDEAMKIFNESEIIRAPVYKKDLDNVVGMIDSKDLIPYYFGIKRARNINRFIQKINFYPSSIELYDLLNEFLSKGIQVAIMVDEYGGTAGVVTLNSILSELMGKEFSKWDVDSMPDIRLLSDNVSVISGEMQIDDFNFHFEDEIESSETETVGGYIIEKLGHFPKRGEIVYTDKYTLKVRLIKKNKVETVEVIQIDNRGDRP